MKDFETGIKTEQGEDRCIVAIEMNGEPKKFFTNSEEMKNILLQVKEMPDGFPFETTIKTEPSAKVELNTYLHETGRRNIRDKTDRVREPGTQQMAHPLGCAGT